MYYNFDKDAAEVERSFIGTIIKNKILSDKSCLFTFNKVKVNTVTNILQGVKVRPSAIDRINVQLLKLVAEVISISVCHIVNLNLEKCKCTLKWKAAVIVPLPKKQL